MLDYKAINKKFWDHKVPYHVKSDFYQTNEFLDGKNVLKPIELDLLGNIKGKSILHLQCHFGLDSLSLARMGAKVTGIDLSPKAIEKARELNEKLGLDAMFHCCDVYDTREHISDTFDIVFTSFGTIGWLPDLDQWAHVIKQSLKPNGKLVFVEFHPVVWMFDYDFTSIAYSHFKGDAIIENSAGTYADRNAPIKNTEISWNHHLSEVFQALSEKGITIKHFEEYNYSPHNCFKNMIETKQGEYMIEKEQGNLPLMYSIVAHPN
jgi:2-polyprenyl-3-methyl-5-hydroxy-6-metoxy-1,4-benzoquinol methylase